METAALERNCRSPAHGPQQNNYRLDGISINDYSNGGPGSVLGGNLGVDAIQEFSLFTSNYSAAYGKASGGVINATTMSGTNDVSRVRVRVYPQQRFGRSQLLRQDFRSAAVPAESVRRIGRRPRNPE